MEKMTNVRVGGDHSVAYALEVRFLAPAVQLRSTGGVRLRAFGGIAPTTSPPGPQLTS